MLKKIAFLVPRPGLDDAGFRAYWRGTHGPVVAGSPGYEQWRLRYVQNHVVAPGPVGAPFAFAGMAEFWLPGDAHNEDAFATTPIYRERIAVDERRFIDMERTVSMAAHEDVVVDGFGPLKLVILRRLAPGVDRTQARLRFADDAVAAARVHVAGWRVNHVIEGSFRLPGARRADALAVDVVEQLWFASHDALRAFAATAAAQRPALFDAAGVQSFEAQELVFFDVLGLPGLAPPAA